MFVKICGVTTAPAVEAAVEAGADALGFVFAPSPRRVTPADARALCRGLPAGILRVAVMRHPAGELVSAVLEEFAPDWLQTDAEDFDALVPPPGCTALPVYRTGGVPPDARRARLLLYEGERSGSGERADWSEARRLAAGTRLVLAGGLDADNVAEAVRRVRPWGVDVSTGVERAPGDKDPDKIKRFVLRARAAAMED